MAQELGSGETRKREESWARQSWPCSPARTRRAPSRRRCSAAAGGLLPTQADHPSLVPSQELVGELADVGSARGARGVEDEALWDPVRRAVAALLVE